MPQIFSIEQCMAERNVHALSCHRHLHPLVLLDLFTSCLLVRGWGWGGGGRLGCARHRSYRTTGPSSLACFVRETIAVPPLMLRQKNLIATSLVVVVHPVVKEMVVESIFSMEPLVPFVHGVIPFCFIPGVAENHWPPRLDFAAPLGVHYDHISPGYRPRN